MPGRGSSAGERVATGLRAPRGLSKALVLTAAAQSGSGRLARPDAPHATPRDATLRHATSRHTEPRHVTPRHAACHATLHRVTPRHAACTSHYVTLRRVTPRVTLRHVTPRYVSRHAMPCHATLHRATPRYPAPRHATRHVTSRRAAPRHATRHVTPRRTALRRAAQSSSCWCRGSGSSKTMATRSTHRLQAFGSMKKGDREKGPRTRPTLPAIPHAAPSLSGRRSPFPTSRGRSGHMAGERQGPCLQVWPPRRDTEEPRDLGGSQLSPQRTGGSRRWKRTCTASAP